MPITHLPKLLHLPMPPHQHAGTTRREKNPLLTRARGLAAATLCGIALLGCGGGGGGAGNAGTGAVDANANANANATAGTRADLGRMIFQDADLSEPRGTACQACHQPNQGFAGNHGSRIGVALGSLPGSLGLRNAMTNAYAGFVPAFGFQTTDGETEAIGGHFWDGRSDTLAQQALGPFLNPLEMNNASRKVVVNKIAASRYAALFKREFGANIFADTDAAFTQIGVAIESFERTDLQPFSSKFDAMVRGRTTLTPAETRGMALFQDASKGNCAGCHLMNATSGKPEDSLFSEFTYYATGIPRNPNIPRNADPAFYDLGICGPERTAPTLPATVPSGVKVEEFCGKFRMPTLRNVAERPAFMHNGFFKDLRDVLRFYSTRNTDPVRWYGSKGVANDLPAAYLANLESTKAPFNRPAGAGPALTEAEISNIIAFLRTLSDGFANP